MSVLVGFDESLDNNLHICDSSVGDVPAAGDAGGLWYCGNQTQSCNDSEITTFGIEPGFFADFRNFSSSSTAATTSTTPTAKVSSPGVTTDGTAAAITTPCSPEPSCPSQTDTKHTFSGGGTAAVALGAVCAVLMALNIYMFFFRRRSGGTPEAIQQPMQAEEKRKEGRELDENVKIGEPIRELPGERLSNIELQ